MPLACGDGLHQDAPVRPPVWWHPRRRVVPPVPALRGHRGPVRRRGRLLLDLLDRQPRRRPMHSGAAARCAWPTAARFSLLLPATPLQMECGHVFHASCVKDLIERKWPGPAITFSFADCPCCKAELRHPSIEDAMVRPHLTRALSVVDM